jgi:hypothetical protein
MLPLCATASRKPCFALVPHCLFQAVAHPRSPSFNSVPLIALLPVETQKPIRKIAKRQPIGRCPRRPAGERVIVLFEPLPKSSVGVVPRAEIVRFAPDVLCPPSGGMGEWWIIGVRLGGLAGRFPCGILWGTESPLQDALSAEPLTPAGHPPSLRLEGLLWRRVSYQVSRRCSESAGRVNNRCTVRVLHP